MTKADLVEEVMRIHGVDNIPAQPLGAPRNAAAKQEMRGQKRMALLNWQTAYAGDEPIVRYEIWRDHQKVGAEAIEVGAADAERPHDLGALAAVVRRGAILEHRRLFDMEPFGKPLPITPTCRHSRTPKRFTRSIGLGP